MNFRLAIQGNLLHLTVAFAVICCASVSHAGQVYYVNGATGSDFNSGTSWVASCRTIGSALVRAAHGDEVWVAEGTYVENLSISNSISLYGGFAGTETSLSRRGNPTNHPTIVDGNNYNRPGYGAVFVWIGEKMSARIDGFTIRKGQPGLYMTRLSNDDSVGGTITIANCTALDNKAHGFYVYFGTGIFLNNRVHDIASDSGAPSAGNGITAWCSSGLVANNVIWNCGTGINPNSIEVVNNTVVSNTVIGIGALSYALPRIKNNIIAYSNIGIGYGGADASLPRNNCFYRNSGGDIVSSHGTIHSSNVRGQDPKFVDKSNNNYHIQAASPCKDRGGNDYVPADLLTDMDGQTRIADAVVDIGADEILPFVDSVKAPVMSPAPGEYEQPVDLTIACETAGAEIRYTTNGTAPSTNSVLYAGPVLLDRWTLVRAKAFHSGMNESIEASGMYKVMHPVYVNGRTGSDANTGESWLGAFRTIQKGISAAGWGDSVWVAEGTYVENLNISNSISLYGGFAGTETSLSRRGNPTNHPAIIDGNNYSRQGLGAVFVWIGEKMSARIDGFTIRKGQPGLYMTRLSNDDSVGGTITIANCTALNNKAHGLYVYFGTGIFLNNQVHDIASNSGAPCAGNGITAWCSSGLVANNVIWNCGTGINPNSIEVVNNTVVSNTVIGIGALTYARPRIVNNIIAYSNVGVGIIDKGLPLYNCFYQNPGGDILGSSGTIHSSNVRGQDPKFVDKSNNNYHIQAASPCKDRGGNDYVPADLLTDMDGDTRICSTNVDIGADELPTGGSADDNHDGMADAWEKVHFGTTAVRPDRDPDMDGMDNLAEYVAGTDPYDENSVLQVQMTGTNASGTVVSFGANGIVGFGYEGRTRYYTLEKSSDLAATNFFWNSVAGYQDIVAPTGQTTQVSYNTVSESSRTSFYRVRARLE